MPGKGNGIVIKIDGDDSGLEKTLSGISGKAKAGLADVKAGIDMTVAALNKLASVAQKGIEYNAKIEQLQVSFETMTGSAEKAAEVVERLRTMGAETPFEMTDLASMTQLLMQYGFTADDAIDKMTMLGDISQGNAEAMTSIATGYAQMSSAGKVNLQDIKQMINGGFNPLQEISERTGESMASLYDRISKGKMSVDEITQSMRAATSEGGKFYQSMEKQSKTLNGQLSTLKDNAMQLLGSITSDMSDEMASAMLPMVNNMLGELQSAFDKGGYEGLLETATDMIPDLLGMMTGKVEDAISGLSRWMPQGVSQLMTAVPGALKSASTVLPQITTALFEVSSTVVRDLVGMLPELVPTLLEGLYNITNSVLIGTANLVTGIWDGIEQAFHQGEKKLGGMWISTERLAKYDFDLEIDMSGATSEIATAYSSIRDALNAGPLTPEQKTEILNMLGNDASAIKAKLKEFGMDGPEADALAEQISAGGQKIADAINALDLGVDVSTVLKWYVQAKGSNVALMHAAKAAGLKDDQVTEVVGLYNTMNGRLSEETPSIAETIYTALTDGLADDEQTVTGLKDQVTTWVNARLAEIEEGYNAAVDALNPKDLEYATKLAELQAQYETAKAEVESIRDDSLVIVDTLAGQSTAAVENAYQTIADIETRIYDLESRISELKGEALTQAEQAYKVVTAGGKADEATISMAVSLKFNEFKLDEQAAEDAYTTTIEELNAQLAAKEITVDEYNAGVENAEEAKQAAIAAAKARFESAFGEILKGIAESEGNAAAFESDSALNAAAASRLSALLGAAFSEEGATWENIDSGVKEKIAALYSQLLGENFTAADLDQQYSDQLPVGAWMVSRINTALEEADTSVMSGKVGEVYGKALQEGLLTGTTFDTTTESATVAAVFASVLTGAQSEVSTAAEKLATNATDAEKTAGESGAKDAGESISTGTGKGILAKQAVAVEAARLMAQAVVNKIRAVFNSNSPSKVAIGLGGDFGEGMSIGLRESMARAVRVAKELSGEIVTSADLQSVTRVNMPNLQQEITIANSQNQTPVLLDGKQIATIQGGNNANELAWIRARNAKGYGYR